MKRRRRDKRKQVRESERGEDRATIRAERGPGRQSAASPARAGDRSVLPSFLLLQPRIRYSETSKTTGAGTHITATRPTLLLLEILFSS